MNELNLTFFMLLGYAQAHWDVVLTFVVGAMVLNLIAYRQQGSYLYMNVLQQSLFGVVLVFTALFFSLPALTGSALSMVNYWVDWMLLVVMAGGYSLVSIAWIYPALRIYAGTKTIA